MRSMFSSVMACAVSPTRLLLSRQSRTTASRPKRLLRQPSGFDGLGQRPSEVRPRDLTLTEEVDDGQRRFEGDSGITSTRHVAILGKHAGLDIPDLVYFDPRLCPA